MEEQTAPEAPAPAAPKGKGLWIGIVVVVIVIVVLLAAVFGGLFGAPPTEEKVLRIGTALDKTGGLSAFGPKNEQGAKLALEQINAGGGVFGSDVVAFHEDSRTDPSAARDAANKLVTTNNVHGIVGSTGSGQCLTVLEVTQANDVFQMSGSCTNPGFSDPATYGTLPSTRWFARTAPSDALQGVVAGYYAYVERGFRNMAVIGINNPYGTGLADVFENSFEGQGGTITMKRIVTETTQGALTYVPDLDAVMATNPEAVYLVAYPPDGVLMVDEYNAGVYPAVEWIFSEGVYDQTFIDDLVTRGVDVSPFEGTAPGAYGGLTGPRYDTWAASYNTRWGMDPGLFDDNVYDSTFLMALAAEASGLASGAGIQSKIMDVANPPGTVILPGEWAKAVAEIAAGRDINYEGASGAVDLDQWGDPFSAYIVWGVNATTDALETLIIYDEAFVGSLLPAPQPMPGLGISPTWAAAARD